MASVDTGNNPNDPNNPNNAPGAVSQPGQTNQPATTAGAGGVTATGSGNVTGQVVGTANPSQPFQNIASYLSANATGGQQLAGQVASTVAAPINEAQTGITNAAQDFTKSVNAGYTPENKDLTKAVSSNPAYVVSENPENVTNFLAQLNNKYSGPSDFTQTPGYSDVQGKIATAQSKANSAQNESGIQSLLGSVEGPTTAGINKLDSLLLSTDPANYKTIQNAGAPAANLLPTLNQTTADQNALAAAGSTNASTSAAAAAKALQEALSGESGNLANQQKTIEGVVNQYNKSVGTINPVTQSIAQDIQNFLAANPQLSLTDATSALAPLMNLKNIDMPDRTTYASSNDYSTVAALQQLGLTPDQLAGLGITPATSKLAQTFQIPKELQDAVGKAPGVEDALSQELGSLSSQIMGAYKPYEDLMGSETRRADVVKQAQDIQTSMSGLQRAADSANAALATPAPGSDVKALQAQADAANKAVSDAQAKYTSLTQSPDYHVGNYWDQIGGMAKGLQWLPGASTGYNDLVAAINAELGKLGNVGVPTLNYSTTKGPDAVPGMPIGKIGKDVGNAAGIATGAGAVGAGALGAGASQAAGIEAANAALGNFGEGLATSGAEGATEAANIGAGVSQGLNLAGPAALAAYGASNVIQNSAKNPLESGIMTLANTGLSLATLSLPPEIFKSIGSSINDVINSIGKFFGGLF